MESVSKSENVITRAVLGLHRQPATGQGGGHIRGEQGRALRGEVGEAMLM